MPAPSHERPFYLVFPPRTDAASLLPRLLGDPAIERIAFPAPWFLDAADVDVLPGVPGLREVTLGTLETFVRAALSACDRRALEALVARDWRATSDSVRHHWLGSGVLGTFAAIFRIAPSAGDRPPPPAFVEDRVHAHPLEVQYRLAPGGGAYDPRAPAHEGSLVLLPFDPSNALGRRECGAGEGAGPVLEVYCYEAGRPAHLAHWAAAAGREGGSVREARPAPEA